MLYTNSIVHLQQLEILPTTSDSWCTKHNISSNKNLPLQNTPFFFKKMNLRPEEEWETIQKEIIEIF